MFELLSKTEQRHLRLVEMLYMEKQWIRTSELAKRLNCSLRIVKNDVAKLKEEYPDISIETSYKGIQLSFKKNKGIKSLYKKLLLESEAFELLRLLFFEGECTTSSLADLLFISSSTLRRLVKKVDRFLNQKFNLKIASNPYRVIGDEKNIHYFYYEFFNEGSPVFKWAFDAIEEEDLNDFLSYFIDFFHVGLSCFNYRFLKIVCAVNITRIWQGHLIEPLDNKIKPVLQEILCCQENKVLMLTNNPFDLIFDTDTLGQLLFPFSTFTLIRDSEHIQLVSKRNETLQQSNHYLDQWLSNIAEEYHIELANKEDLIVNLSNLSNFYEDQIQTKTLLYDERLLFIQSIGRRFPKLYQQFMQGIKVYRSKMQKFYDETVVDHLIYEIFTHWENLFTELYSRYERSVRLVILSASDDYHAKLMKQMITYQFSSALEIDLYPKHALSIDELKALPYDIVISSSTLPDIESPQCICVENIPTDNDIESIYAAIQEIRAKNIQIEHAR